jgi:hypothetical protein
MRHDSDLPIPRDVVVRMGRCISIVYSRTTGAFLLMTFLLSGQTSCVWSKAVVKKVGDWEQDQRNIHRRCDEMTDEHLRN